MPDRRKHRGSHPQDEALFAPDQVRLLQQAVSDLSWLFTRGYSEPSAVKLVGDRYQLKERQRNALLRAACSDQSLSRRKTSERDPTACRGNVVVDGYNLLITIESALGGGVVLGCRDGCYRDIAGLHGTYRAVEETLPALRIVGQGTAELGIEAVMWLFDAPVSNSGRLCKLVLDLARKEQWRWQAELATDVDPRLAYSEEPVATSDSWVLDRASAWTNLGRYLIDRYVPDARIRRLST